jgi:hypothetical protein
MSIIDPDGGRRYLEIFIQDFERQAKVEPFLR